LTLNGDLCVEVVVALAPYACAAGCFGFLLFWAALAFFALPARSSGVGGPLVERLAEISVETNRIALTVEVSRARFRTVSISAVFFLQRMAAMDVKILRLSDD
jgi:hypothetical protein